MLEDVSLLLEDGVAADESVELGWAEVADESVVEPLGVVPTLGAALVPGEVLMSDDEGTGAALGDSPCVPEVAPVLPSDDVWAMVTPAALTRATTAAMLKVLDRSFICWTPLR
jgi:hypothetical protein